MRLKYSENYYLRVLLGKVRIKEMMNTPAISIDLESPFSQVAELLSKHSIRHLPVINRQKELVGLVTQRDLYKIHSPRKLENGEWYYDKDVLDGFVLSHVMNTELFTMTGSDTVADAIKAMVKHKYGCIPIIDKKNVLIGMITQYDILKMAVDILEEK